MNQYPPSPLDIVRTPVGDFFVCEHKDYDARDGWDTSESLVMEFNERKGWEEHIKTIESFAAMFPHLEIDEFQKEIHFRMMQIDVPAGKIGEILTPEVFLNTTKAYKEEHEEGEVDVNSDGFKRTLEGITMALKNCAFEQAIRGRSKYGLNMPGGKTVGQTVVNPDKNGFSLIDDGIGSNCGYGSARIQFYKLGKVLEREGEDNFYRETLEMECLGETYFKYLSACDLGRIKNGEGRADMTLIELDGNIAAIGLGELENSLDLEYFGAKLLDKPQTKSL